MKKLLILSTALVLVGCNHPVKQEDLATDETPDGLSYLGRVQFGDVFKFCDAGRAVYYVESRSDSIFVVDDAPECANSGGATGESNAPAGQVQSTR